MRVIPILVLLLCIGSFSFGANTAIWSKCTSDYCAYLYETPPCGLSVKVTTSSGFPLFEQPFDLAVSNQVCAPQFLGCTYCIELQNLTKASDGNVHPCVYLKSNCTSGAKTTTNLGCVDTTNNLAQCLYPQGCPSGCSSHGTCLANGTCSCNSGWYGDDCADQAPLFNECRNIPPYGNVCMQLETVECAVAATIYFKGPPQITLYETTIAAPAFNTYFDTESCFSITPNCGACLYWTDFVLTETYAHACPAVNASCTGMPATSWEFDCFEDDELVPACFGPCPNNCSNHGDCINGACQCNSQYKGATCNIPRCDAIGVYNCYGNGECIAPNTCKCNSGWTGSSCDAAVCSGVADCSGNGRCTGPNHCTCNANYTGASCTESVCPYQCQHGKCVAGSCVCASGWEGDDCSTQRLTPGKDDGHTPKTTYVVIGVVVGLVVAGAGGLGTFFVLRWRRTQRTGSSVFSFDDGGLIQVPDRPDEDEQ